ncbi:MAG: glycosyltransferase [Pseudomonadota bacterium]
MKFVLFKGQSQYGSLRLHIDQLGSALQQSGHEVRIIDLLEAHWRDTLSATFLDPPDCYFDLNGMVGEVAAKCDQLGAVYATLYLDHPLHHPARLAVSARRYALLLLDRSHVQFVRTWPEARGAAYLGLLPPGAIALPDAVDTSDEGFAKRDIPLLFTGTYRGVPEPAWADWEESPAKQLVAEVASRMVSDGGLAVLDAYKACLADRRVGFDEALFTSLIPVLRAVQVFCEAYHRDQLLHALGKVGVPLQVYGSGWEPLAARYPNIQYGGEGSFGETLHLLRRSRVVLNTNNGFVAGGHERVFTAMCAGATVFSDASRYYAETFREGREIVTFPWSRLSEAPGRLVALMNDTERTAAIARAGYKRAVAEHQWSDRAAKLVKVVKQVR